MARRATASGAHTHLIVNTDGASRGNPGLAGAGWVLRSDHGALVDAGGRFLGVQTNNVAEYHGVLGGLSVARERGARKVTLRADSELLIRQLEGRYKVRAPNLQPLYEQARALLRAFESYTLEHVRRELNGDADTEANRAIDERPR